MEPASNGGTANEGVVYKLNKAGKEKVLYICTWCVLKDALF